MTERYHAPPHGNPPDPERPASEQEEPQAQAHAAPTAPITASPDAGTEPPKDAAPPGEHVSEPFSIDKEQERLVWSPPVPQYPARPTRQEPVQYEAPRPQPAPQYAPQAYVPPQQPPGAPSPQPHIPPQPTYAPAIPGGYSAPVNHYAPQPQPQMVVAPPATKVSSARMGRRMMRRMVMGGSTVGKTVFGVRPVLTVAFIAVLLLTGFFAYDKWLAGSGTTSATPNAPNKNGTITLPPETPSVQAYLSAIQKGDTDAVWNALGAQEKAHRISRGDDKTVLDAVLKMEQQNGFTYSGYHYVAGFPKDGATDPTKGGIYFYVADVGKGGQKQAVPMVFVMDDKGQISQVTDQLYEYVLQQLKGP